MGDWPYVRSLHVFQDLVEQDDELFERCLTGFKAKRHLEKALKRCLKISIFLYNKCINAYRPQSLISEQQVIGNWCLFCLLCYLLKQVKTNSREEVFLSDDVDSPNHLSKKDLFDIVMGLVELRVMFFSCEERTVISHAVQFSVLVEIGPADNGAITMKVIDYVYF